MKLQHQITDRRLWAADMGGAPAAEAPAAPAPEAPAPEAPASAPAWEGQAVWDYDPFEGEAEASDPPSDPIAPQETPPTGAEEPQAPAQPEAPAPAGDQLVSVLEQLRDKLAAPPAPVPSESPQAERPSEPEDYFPDVAVPPALINAMASDDPGERQIATTMLVRGTMNMVMRKSVEMWQSFIKEGLPELLASHNQLETQVKTIEQDFYGTYPKLNNPALKPLIAHITQQKVTALGQNYRGWNQELRDSIAQEVLGLVVGLVEAPAGGPTPPPPAPFSPTPAARPMAPVATGEDWRDFF